MEAPVPTPAAADAVAGELDRYTSNVADRIPLTLEELVPAFRRQQHEEPLVPQVLHVRQALLLPPAAGPLRDCDAVAFDQFRVHRGRILALRDRPGDVEPITVRDVRDSELLNESLDRCSNAPILHANLPPLQ
jgi:hypothetical protein